ncbi:Cat eye syndrome critical region protein 5 [Madurella mycetomatis]|uniref:Cat eye syndrome critical region protein 5 n=1 Tax=Madurella mycetomatis TaxID=100816 RepID=A0A175W5U2_9PEZI|nr:Cat eye syndrome critical region protein 5 [Madurella mycetomatis]
MSGFKEVEFGAPPPKNQMDTPPDSPDKTTQPKDFPIHAKVDDENRGGILQRRNESRGSLGADFAVPTLPSPHNTIEVPALRSPDADTAQFMHNLSASPSMKERRVSRNSFGAALPIPRSKRQSRLSSVTCPDHQEALKTGRQGMPPIQPTREILASQVQDAHTGKVKAAKNMAFVFDIDGVLVHGDRLIPEGKQVLEMLNGDNQLGIRIPHIFLTNGSGKPELARTEQLSKILRNPISTEQFIQSHTPMRALAEYYRTVLVVGGEGYRCREVAEQYGFKDIIVPNDIVAWDTSIAPYRVFTEEERASSRPRDFTKVNIDAIMVFSDSRDYATDMQIIVDLLRSENGRLGTIAKDPVLQRIPIYFSQGDMLCPTEHPIPRMSQGAFRIGLEAMYKALTGLELERVVYGKPELATYKYADEVIASWMDMLHGEERVPENIYMIGDNPASDIIGGNMYGWNTCLVRTGVFQGGENDEENPANFGVFANVWEAVTTACRKELGEDFVFKWDERGINPVLHDSVAASAIEV